MKNSYFEKNISLLVLASLMVTSCQSLNTNPTKTAVPNHAEIPTQTSTQHPSTQMPEVPTPTATVAPIKTGINLDLADVPLGFNQAPYDLIGITAEQISGKQFSNENPFLFFNAKNDQLIIGFTTLLDSDADKANFETLLEKPERAIKVFSDFYGATQITGESKFQGIEFLGDAASNMRITLEIALNPSYSLSYNVSMVAFRSKNLGVYMVEVINAELDIESIFPDYANRLGTKTENLTDLSTLVSPSALSTEQSVSWINPGAWVLQENFEKVGLAEIGITQEEWEGAGIDYDSFYVYRNPDEKKTMIGFNTLLETYEDVGTFDMQSEQRLFEIENREFSVILKQLTIMAGAENLGEVKQMLNVQGDGYLSVFINSDAIIGQTIVADLNGVSYQFELIAVREQNTKFLLFTFQPEESTNKELLPLFNQNHASQLNLLIKSTQLFRKKYTLSEIPESLVSNPLISLQARRSQAPNGTYSVDFAKLLPDFLYPPTELLNITSEQLSMQSFTNERLFYLVGRNQHIFGFTVPLDTDENIQNFNIIIDTPNDAVKDMLIFHKVTNSELDKRKKAFSDLGDAQVYANIHFFSPTESKGGKMEMLAFQKNGTGFYFLTVYSAFYEGASIFPDFVNRLVQSMDEQTAFLTATPTQPAQNNSTPTGLPVYVPLESSNPLIAWIEPGRSYLPLGYERTTLEDIKISKEEWEEIGFDYDTLFIYKHPDGPKIVLGYNVLLETYDEVGKFDIDIQELDPILEKLATAIGATSIREQISKEKDMFAFSRCSMWRSLTGDINGTPYRFQLVKTRKDNIGFLILTIEPPVADDRQTSYEFTSNACYSTIGLLSITQNFIIDFPIYKASDLLTPAP